MFAAAIPSVDANLLNLMSYGAIGLGCILAFLAYSLLRAELAKPIHHKGDKTTIYMFMGFSLTLVLLGSVAEWRRDGHQAKVANDLRTQVDQMEREADCLRAKIVVRDHNIGLFRQRENEHIIHYETLVKTVNDAKLDQADQQSLKRLAKMAADSLKAYRPTRVVELKDAEGSCDRAR